MGLLEACIERPSDRDEIVVRGWDVPDHEVRELLQVLLERVLPLSMELVGDDDLERLLEVLDREGRYLDVQAAEPVRCQDDAGRELAHRDIISSRFPTPFSNSTRACASCSSISRRVCSSSRSRPDSSAISVVTGRWCTYTWDRLRRTA